MRNKPQPTNIKTLIIYEGFHRVVKAIAALERAPNDADATLAWNIWPWRVDMLQFPAIAAEALIEAIEAHLIVLAGLRAQSLPVWLPDWLEQWATHRPIEDAAPAIIGRRNDHMFSAPPPPELSRF